MLRVTLCIVVGWGIIVAGCGGSSKPHATVTGGCHGVTRTGDQAPATNFTPDQICAAAGRPERIDSEPVGVVWGYRNGGIVLFARNGRARLVFPVSGWESTRGTRADQLGVAEPVFVIRTPLPGRASIGRAVAATSGCTACHRIGDAGAGGPGPALTHIGSKLTRAQIVQALIHPTSPMPSFRHLAPWKFDALADYLASLR